MSENDQPAPKRRKVSLACLQCRERKVRCSGEKPICASCRRRPGALSTECSYAIQSDVESHVNESIQQLFQRLQRLESQSSAAAAERESNQSTSSSHPESWPNERKRSQGDGAIQRSNTITGGTEVNASLDPHLIEARRRVEQDTTRLLQNPECWPLLNQSFERFQRSLTQNGRRPSESDPSSIPSTFMQPISKALARRPTITQAEDVDSNIWRQEKQLETQEPGETPATDAMGTSSMYDEESPEDTAQYYGGSSGIAFMRAISKVLAGTVEKDQQSVRSSSVTGSLGAGVSKQSERSGPLSQLPRFETPGLLPDYFALPPRSVSDYLLENYWTRAYPLYPLLHRPSFEAAYAILWSPTASEHLLAQESDAGLGNKFDAGPSTSCFYCALNMMLALGSQFAEVSAPRRKDLAAMFENRSKKLLVVDMMDRGSVAVVQTLLLTGQYMQSTLYPQRCWNVIGVACRIAQALGLHVETSPGKTGLLELEMRRRVWYGCILLDMFASMTMGRPLMISHQYSTCSPSLIDDEQIPNASPSLPPNSLSKVGFFLEAIKLTQTLGIILTTIYDQSICHTNEVTGLNGLVKSRDGPIATDLKTVLELDKRLVRFQNELPAQLRWGDDGDNLRQALGDSVGYIQMQTNVLHARFLQTRILLYRESFIQMCQESISKLDNQQHEDDQNPEFDLDTFYMTRCAASCVTSAKELLDLVHRTSQTKNTDAWWYNVYFTHTSGMVVKLAQLCNPLKQIVSTQTLDESWVSCREILSRMTSYSPVAQRCLDSLEAIQEKVSLHESKKTRIKPNSSHTDREEPNTSKVSSSDPELPNSKNGAVTQDYDGRDGTTSHDYGHSIDLESSGDRGVTLDEPYHPGGILEDESTWSTDLRYWWNFPGIDFDTEGLNLIK